MPCASQLRCKRLRSNVAALSIVAIATLVVPADRLIYVADSESRDGRTNTGQFALPQTGYGYNLGAQRGIRIGSARDGSVKYFIPDPCPYPYAAGSSMAEGVTADYEGNVYGADFLGDVRKFVRK